MVFCVVGVWASAFGLQSLGFSFRASTFGQVSGLFTFGLLALRLLAFAQAERQKSRISLCLGRSAFGDGLVLLNFWRWAFDGRPAFSFECFGQRGRGAEKRVGF